MTSRVASILVLVVLGATMVLALSVATPWRPLRTAAAPLHPAASPSVSRDFSPDERARAESYVAKARPPAYLALLVGLVVSLLLGFTPLGARLIGLAAAPLGGGWVAKTLAGGFAVLLVGRLVSLPFAARGHQVRREFGLSGQSWAAWALDQAKAFALAAGIALLVLTALFALIRALPRAWPIPVAAGAAGIVLAVSFLYPVLVEPVFNRFTPMPAGELRTSLLALADKDGVPVRDVLVADASRRTTALNAYVSGFGSTRRIVLYDTLVDGIPDNEIRVVVAHELGHAKYRDVLAATVAGALSAGALVGLIGLALTSGALLRRSGAESAADPRVLALVLAVVAVAGTLSGPMQQLVSRRVETRADVSALELTADPLGAATAQRRLSVENLSDPEPPAWVFALFASHPTAPQRIELARAWARAHGQPELPALAP